MLRVAVDAMGGDRAPEEIVRGAAAASLADPALELILVGDAARIGRLLTESRHAAERVRIHHAPQVIGPHDRVAEALAARPACSIRVAAELVGAGEADVLIGAGVPAATVAAVERHLRRMPGVRAAALAAVEPTAARHGEKHHPFTLVLDTGASPEVTPDDLVTFAVLGSVWSSRVSRTPRPRIALLSGGLDAGRRAGSLTEAHRLLLEHTGLHFVGDVAPLEVPQGSADVVVCGGEIGGVLVAMLEGVPALALGQVRYAAKERLLWRATAAVLAGGLGRLRTLIDWPEYAGAPLLGYERLVLSLHARADARSLANAIRLASRMLRAGLLEELRAKALEVARRLSATTGVGAP